MSKKIQVKMNGKWREVFSVAIIEDPRHVVSQDITDIRLVDESECEKNEEHRQTCTCFSCLPKHFEPDCEHKCSCYKCIAKNGIKTSKIDRARDMIGFRMDEDRQEDFETLKEYLEIEYGDMVEIWTFPPKKSECKHESDMCVSTKDKGVFRSVCKKCEEWYYNNGHIKPKKIEKLPILDHSMTDFYDVLDNRKLIIKIIDYINKE